MAEYPGTGPGPTLPSSDPPLPGDLAGSYFDDQLKNVGLSEQQKAMLSGKFEQTFTAFIEDTLMTLMGSALTSLSNLPGGQEEVSRIAALVRGGSAGGAGGAGAGSHASPVAQTPIPAARSSAQAQPAQPSHYQEPGAPAPGAGADDDQAQPYVPPGQRFQEGREMVQNATMGSVAGAAFHQAQRYISEKTPSWEVADEAAPEGQRVYVRRDASGQVTDQVSEADHPHRAAQIRATATGFQVAGRLLGSSGTVGALGAVATRVAGPIGIAVGATQVIGHQFEKQFDAAAPYRQAFGEQETGMFAARDRFKEWMTGLEGFGTVGGARAREQFQVASGMGLRGERRDQATDFASDMFKRFGMDTSASMQIVQQATEQGGTSLIAFSDAITEVSRAAVEAGRSSKEAIDDFVAAQDAVSKITPSGTAAVAVTKDLASINEAMPRALSQAIGGTKGLASLLTQQNITQIAAMTGQDPNEAVFRASNPATTQGQVQRTVTGLGEIIVQQVGAAIGMSPQEVYAEVARLTGGKPVSVNEQFAIFQQLCGGQEAAAGIVQQITARVMEQFGLQIPFAQVINLFFQTASGIFGSPPEVAGSTKAAVNAATDIARGVLGKGGGAKGGKGGGDGDAYHKVSTATHVVPGPVGVNNDQGPVHTKGYIDQQKAILKNLGFKGTYDSGTAAGKISDNPEDEAALSAYLKMTAKTGRQDKVIEGLLAKGNADKLTEASGAQDLGSVRYQVRDGKGRKNVSLAEIISNPKYLAQADAGNLGIVNTDTPNENPTPVSDIVGAGAVSSAGAAGTGDGKGANKGGRGGDKGAGGKQVIVHEIRPSKELRRYFDGWEGPSQAQRDGVPASGQWPTNVRDYG